MSELNASGSPFRFGIIYNRRTLMRWQAEVIRRVQHEEGIPTVAIELHGGGEICEARASIPWRMYYRGRLQRRARTQWPVDASSVLGWLPMVRCNAQAAAGSALYVPHADVKKVQQYDLDFILAFVSKRLSGPLLTSARYGVWWFRHGGAGTDFAAGADLIEVHGRKSIAEVRLLQMAEDAANDVILHRGWVRTAPHSYPLTTDVAHNVTVDWISRMCRQLKLAGVPVDAPRVGQQAIDVPAASGVARFLARQTYRNAARALRGLARHEHWSVGIVNSPISSFLAPDSLPPADWLTSPSDRYYLADPFGIPTECGPVLLVEAFDYLRRRGHVTTITASSSATADMMPVLRSKGHMSYPYLFSWRGDIFCTPENCEERKVILYRAVDFPRKWQKVGTLIDGFAAADPTVVRHNGRWYMFCTDDDLGTESKLHVYHASDLLGPWYPHALNPVKTDVRSARPAGTPFAVNGKLYRPAQDCSAGYGRGVAINEVTSLTPSVFRETVATRVTPNQHGPFPKGLHTISALGPMTLIDGRRETLILYSLLGRMCVGWAHTKAKSFGK